MMVKVEVFQLKLTPTTSTTYQLLPNTK